MRAPLAASDNSPDRYELRDPDVRLMLEVRDDNAAAFEELMLRYQNRLVTVLDHLVGGRDQAEDLAQEVFLRVYRSRKRYTPGAEVLDLAVHDRQQRGVECTPDAVAPPRGEPVGQRR